MKKKYIAPFIKVRNIDNDQLMAASTVTLSPSDGEPQKGSDGIYIGSKKGFFDSSDESNSSSSIWDNE